MSCSEGNRFERKHRLLDAATFGRVFEKATRSRDKYFTVLCRTNDGLGARLGLAIAKKHCKLATARNRIKRTVRESFRCHTALLDNIDIVVLNQPAAKDAGNDILRNSLQRHWQRCASAAEQQREAATDG